MDKLKTFEEFLATQTAHLSAYDFSINLILTALLCFLLGQIYIRFGHSLSNRRQFAQNLLVVGSTTMLIITIVKSSLALSLGLVGALSIVRFRAAIKEPEELSFLFLCIAIGLGLGAGQRTITLIGFTMISLVIYFKRYSFKNTGDDSAVFLIVRSNASSETNLKDITDTVLRHSPRINIKRVDQTENYLEVSIALDLTDISDLSVLKDDLIALDPSPTITILDAT